MTNESPETTPEVDYSQYVLPNGVDWTEPPCEGSVGSAPNLDDIQAQLQENQSAAIEHRQARPLAIHCGFCGGYHKEMQPSIASLIGGEVIGDYTGDNPSGDEPPSGDAPSLPEAPPGDSDVATTNQVNETPELTDIFPTETTNDTSSTTDESSSSAG